MEDILSGLTNDEIEEDNRRKQCIPARVVVCMLIFIIEVSTGWHNTSFVFTLMTLSQDQNTTYGESGCSEVVTRYSIENKSLKHNQSVQLQLFCPISYWLGYGFSSLPSGLIAENFGSRSLVFWATVGSSFTVALFPWAIKMYTGITILFGFIDGIFMGLKRPALHALIAQWAPASEKVYFVCCMSGKAFGIAVSEILFATLVPTIGIVTMQYVTAFLRAVIGCVWYLFLYNTPANHVRISRREVVYIQKTTGITINEHKVVIFPIRDALLSMKFIAIVGLFLPYTWYLQVFSFQDYIYLRSIMGLSYKYMPYISTIPQLIHMVGSGAGLLLTIYLQRRGDISLAQIRKLMVFFSHIIPAALIVTIEVPSCNTEFLLTFWSLIWFFRGASITGFMLNVHDLAPNYAGSLNGIAEFTSSISGIVFIYVWGSGSTMDHMILHRHIIWSVTAMLHLLTGIFYICVGSAKEQTWNWPSPMPSAGNTDQSISSASLSSVDL